MKLEVVALALTAVLSVYASALTELKDCLSLSKQNYTICVESNGEVGITRSEDDAEIDGENDRVLDNCVDKYSRLMYLYLIDDLSGVNCAEVIHAKAHLSERDFDHVETAPSIIRAGLPEFARPLKYDPGGSASEVQNRTTVERRQTSGSDYMGFAQDSGGNLWFSTFPSVYADNNCQNYDHINSYARSCDNTSQGYKGFSAQNTSYHNPRILVVKIYYHHHCPLNQARKFTLYNPGDTFWCAQRPNTYSWGGYYRAKAGDE